MLFSEAALLRCADDVTCRPLFTRLWILNRSRFFRWNLTRYDDAGACPLGLLSDVVTKLAAELARLGVTVFTRTAKTLDRVPRTAALRISRFDRRTAPQNKSDRKRDCKPGFRKPWPLAQQSLFDSLHTARISRISILTWSVIASLSRLRRWDPRCPWYNRSWQNDWNFVAHLRCLENVAVGNEITIENLIAVPPDMDLTFVL
jgi:hypothetical protein